MQSVLDVTKARGNLVNRIGDSPLRNSVLQFKVVFTNRQWAVGYQKGNSVLKSSFNHQKKRLSSLVPMRRRNRAEAGPLYLI